MEVNTLPVDAVPDEVCIKGNILKTCELSIWSVKQAGASMPSKTSEGRRGPRRGVSCPGNRDISHFLHAERHVASLVGEVGYLRSQADNVAVVNSICGLSLSIDESLLQVKAI